MTERKGDHAFCRNEPNVRCTVRQRDTTCVNEALLTVTNELLAQINPTTIPARGLPGYTFERAPGESWRSKFDRKRNLIVVNNGHRTSFTPRARNRSSFATLCGSMPRSWCCTISLAFPPTTCWNGWSSFHCERKNIFDCGAQLHRKRSGSGQKI
jgi:hypothetical protein